MNIKNFAELKQQISQKVDTLQQSDVLAMSTEVTSSFVIFAVLVLLVVLTRRCKL